MAFKNGNFDIPAGLTPPTVRDDGQNVRRFSSKRPLIPENSTAMAPADATKIAATELSVPSADKPQGRMISEGMGGNTFR